MTTGTVHHAQNGAAHPLRVILVGRTGLDGKLRRDPSIELVRAADSFDAIGELSDPIDSTSPERAVVIVGAADEPRESVGGPAALTRALRQIDPAVRVLGVGDSLGGARPSLASFDGVVSPEADSAAVRRAIDGPPPVHAAPRETQSTAQPEPAEPPVAQVPSASRGGTAAPGEPAPARVERTPEVVVRAKEPPRPPVSGSRQPEISAPAVPGFLDGPLPEPPKSARTKAPGARDTALVDAMLGGVSVLGPAMELIGSRLGAPNITFETGEAGEGVPVESGGRVFGRLVGAGDRSQVVGGAEAWNTRLEAEAGWLAGWLRLESQRRELERAAFTDPLTGAWNRRYFDRYIVAAIDQAREARLPVTVMVFDIDDFKSYNDRFGHAAGDEILTETVRLLRSTIRPSDRVCRIGGDEFAVVFYEPAGPRDPSSKPPESVAHIAHRFQQQVCAHRFPKLSASAQGTLTISGGLATYPWDGVDPAALIARADELAMRSKAQGKNALTFGPAAEKVCRATPGTDARPDGH